jgi:hypothetical protein
MVMAENGSNNPIASFIDTQKALKGISYPADRETLLDTAKSNGAGNDVTSALEALKDDSYGSPAEVSKAVGNEE